MSNQHQNSNLVIKNGVFLFFRLLLVLFLGFFATRLSLQVLGDEKFGIYSIVCGIIALFAIISMPIRDSIQRFLNVEFAKNSIVPSIVLRTAIRLNAAMILFISILYETVGLVLINYVIKYPAEEQLAVNIIFQISVLTNIFGFAALPYVSLLFAKENMGVPAVCEICGSLLKIGLLYTIPFIPINALVPYASVFLIVNIVPYVFYIYYCNRNYPESFKNAGAIDNSLKKNMLSFSSWSFLEAISGIALTYVSNVFINIFGGVLYNTAYGISKQLQNAVVSFSSNVLKASDPQIISNTTIENYGYRDRLLMATAKISLIGTAFAYIVFHYYGEILLELWLNDIPLYAIEFCELSILATVFASVTLPFRTSIMASGNIRNYFITYFVISLLSMVIMYVVLKMGSPMIAVMYIIAISGLVMTLVTILFSYLEAKINIVYITLETLRSVAVIIITSVSVKGMIFIWGLGLSASIASICIGALVLFLTTYMLALNNQDKQRVRNIVSMIYKKTSKN